MHIVAIRQTRKPLQQIIKNVEFLNIKLKINKNVLIPRFCSELLCDIIIKDISKKGNNFCVLDLCCGSGALGIAISKNTNNDVWLSDVSDKALYVARKNAKLNHVNVKIVNSDLFKNISEKFDLIVSNPPYIPTSEINLLQEEVKNFEPVLALDGGSDGLKFYKEIIKNAPNFLNKNGEIYFEIGNNQATQIKKMLTKNFCDIKILKDYENKNRFIYAMLKD
jgi:release factor glutamine methyltransferase